MGLLTLLERRASLENPSTTLADPDVWLTDAFGGGAASSGIRVSRETALTYAAVWRAVSLVSRDTAKLPLFVYRRLDEGGKERARQHAAFRLLRRKVNPEHTAGYFRTLLTGHALLEGNGYAHILRNGDGTPATLTPMAPTKVTPTRVGGELRYAVQRDDGGMRWLLPSNVLHIRGMGYDGLTGYSVIAKARESLGLGLAASKYGSVFFKNSARPNMVLEHPAKISAEAAANLKKSWNELYSGVDNAHKTAVLEEGMKAHGLSINAKDAQLLETRKFEIREVANWFGVPPHKLGDDSRTSHSSLEQENQAYLDEALDPWLATWEEECTDKLLSEDEKNNDTHFVEFVRSALVRADMPTRFSSYNTALQGGWMSRDEIRDRENMNPIPDGEGQAFYVPLNMTTTGDSEMAPDDEADRKTRESYRLMIVDTLRLMVRRYGRSAAKAAKHPDGFLNWLDTAHAEHRSVFVEAMAPTGKADALADEHFAALRDVLLTASECQPAELPSRVSAAMTEFGRTWPERAAAKIVET